MDAAMVARLFEGPSDIEDVQARDRQFREMGVSGVPLFIVAGRHAVPGCQPKELWLKVIDDIMEQAGQAP